MKQHPYRVLNIATGLAVLLALGFGPEIFNRGFQAGGPARAAAPLAQPAAGQQGTLEPEMVPVGQVIAAQANAALRQIREDMKADLKHQLSLSPLLAQPSPTEFADDAASGHQDAAPWSLTVANVAGESVESQAGP